MARRKLFEPGEMVVSFTGEAGMVLSGEAYLRAKDTMKEGNRPGHYFAPGCCHHPDFITQVPVLFEDGTYDVMRALNIKKAPHLPQEKRRRLLAMMVEPVR